MQGEGWEHMDKDGGELVQAVEDEAVLPDQDGHHEHTHAQRVVGLEPDQAVGEQDGLHQDWHVHEVAEVQHEQVVILCTVLHVSVTNVQCIWYSQWLSHKKGIPVGEKSCHKNQIEAGEVLRISESQKLCQDYAGDSKCEGQLVHQFHLVP